MRLHIEFEDDLVDQIDQAAGSRRRSQFVRDAVIAALDHRARSAAILAARGTLTDQGHDWDADPATWVRTQRQRDERRVG